MVNLLTERLETVNTIAFTALGATAIVFLTNATRKAISVGSPKRAAIALDQPRFKPGNAIAFAVRDKLYGGTVYMENVQPS